MPTLTSTTGLGGVTLASRQKVIFHQEICWRGRGSKTQNCIICHHFLSSKTTPRWRSLFFQPLKRNQWFRRPPWHVLYTSHSHNLISLAYNSLCGACARWPKNWYLVKSMLPNLKGFLWMARPSLLDTASLFEKLRTLLLHVPQCPRCNLP